jgi:hypothetical protein
VRILSIDPGETTGWAVWENGELVNQGQDDHTDFLDTLESLLQAVHEGQGPDLDLLVVEEYRLRQSASKAMVGNTFLTCEIIGVIGWLARKFTVGVAYQTPAQKDWWDNDKLKRAGLYARGLDHSRDAVRHGLYFWYLGQGKDVPKKRSLEEVLGLVGVASGDSGAGEAPGQEAGVEPDRSAQG